MSRDELFAEIRRHAARWLARPEPQPVVEPVVWRSCEHCRGGVAFFYDDKPVRCPMCDGAGSIELPFHEAYGRAHGKTELLRRIAEEGKK